MGAIITNNAIPETLIQDIIELKFAHTIKAIPTNKNIPVTTSIEILLLFPPGL
jgi:hypothetical protein